MAEGVQAMDEQTLRELLARHALDDADERSLEALSSLAQEAYGLGWADGRRQSGLRKQQIQELVRDETRLQAALDRLTPDERRVAELRFGLVDEGLGPHPLRGKVGKTLGISKERARELEDSAITKMLAVAE